MSAPTQTPTSTSTSTEQESRWRLVVVPLFVVMTVGVLALGVTMMRRRYGLGGFAPGGPHDHPAHYHAGGRGGDRNLDPSYYHSYRRPGAGAGVPMTGRRRRGGDHHPYASLGDDGAADLEAGRGRGGQQQPGGANGHYGPRQRREEGLNELGEAPPPYVGAGEGKKGGGEAPGPGPAPAVDGGSGVETSSPAREAPPAPAAPPAAAAASSPPAYSEARRG
ncbi:hypothetical protein RB594_002342 [Gaeumannomyces avenae]